MELIKLTHAVTKTELYVVRQKVCGVFRWPAKGATMVVADGETAFPAVESVEEVNSLLTGNALITSANEGGNENGTNERHDAPVQGS